MPTTLSANRVVAGDPAIVALLIADPAAAAFIPRTSLTSAQPGAIVGLLQLNDDDRRELRIITTPPRRTPTSYIAEFQIEIEGMPAATGTLDVTSAGPARSRVIFSLTSQEEIPEEFAGAFDSIVTGFFDGLERAAEQQHQAA
jgi:hypothetical protein